METTTLGLVFRVYSPLSTLWVYCNMIPTYPIFYLLDQSQEGEFPTAEVFVKEYVKGV